MFLITKTRNMLKALKTGRLREETLARAIFAAKEPSQKKLNSFKYLLARDQFACWKENRVQIIHEGFTSYEISNKTLQSKKLMCFVAEISNLFVTKKQLCGFFWAPSFRRSILNLVSSGMGNVSFSVASLGFFLYWKTVILSLIKH